MSYSIIIPFYNEEETAKNVLAEVIETNPEAEIIAINDGSADKTWEIMQEFLPRVRALQLPVNKGQSAAMYAGLRKATRPVVALMDGDGQNDPAEIPKLVAELEKSGKDFVCGYRANRQDTASRRYASKFANKIRRAFLHDGVRDTGCSLKAMKRECIDALVPFNGMHRYIPALLLQANHDFSEIPVNHRSRFAGESKYTNWDRALRGIHDLIGVSWLIKRKVPFATEEAAPPQNPV
ncbi:glycosyltransferase family 2 protein [Roseibacillus ishigakijimensis]|uniref:Glycosyltransferase family 2 protein n=1 Tax=Roseibacillus ishigakijimensis TaxID=454146 RepID=A0A934RRF2_9BACT|nr:glycosyltransferase family 2 protein [Roseibacillus ishigakijimensis]MBK1834088.1 glycosyltransferase family 2 protein [Roseibacillus ishigakijimensis]